MAETDRLELGERAAGLVSGENFELPAAYQGWPASRRRRVEASTRASLVRATARATAKGKGARR